MIYRSDKFRDRRAMLLGDEDLRSITARATSLRERLSSGQQMADAAFDETIAFRLEAWRQALGGGEDAFQRRLAWDGLDVQTVMTALRSPPAVDGDLPSWAGVLREALDEATRLEREHEPGPTASNPLPFEELLLPFVLVGRARLSVIASPRHEGLLAGDARRALENALLAPLADCAALAFNMEFAIFRGELWQPDWLGPAVPEQSQRTQYEGFVDAMLAGGLAAFFREYAVLARLLSRMTELWVEATSEFLARLEADRADIEATFGAGEPLGQVEELRPALSDPHLGRRFVNSLTFSSGCRVVYKPKDLGMEAAWNNLLAWLNGHDVEPRLRMLTVLDRGTHGWVEYAQHAHCSSLEEAQRYYRRAGMLLCLVYALDGTDCHLENVVACGDHPVLVDLETLLQHRLAVAPELTREARASAGEALAESVLRTGLLPAWQFSVKHGIDHDTSGLGASGSRASLSVHRWRHVNTDAMELVEARVEMNVDASGPMLGGDPMSLADYADELIDGFEAMYRLLMACRLELIRGPLDEMQHRRVRFLYRSTRVYGLVLKGLRDPRHLRDGADWGIQLEQLARAFAGAAQRPPFWPLVDAEQRAMEQGDIPFFTASTDATAITMGDTVLVEEAFEDGSLSGMLQRLRSLDATDLARQTRIIRSALFCHTAREPPTTIAAAEPLEARTPPTADRMLAAAEAIAIEINESAIHGRDGSLTWLAPQFLPQTGRFRFQALGPGLYGGQCGIALFLAALGSIQGERWRGPALSAVQELRSDLARYSRWLVSELGSGVAGLGGVIYGLVRIGVLLAEPALIDDAMSAASHVDAELASVNAPVDVMLGTAGDLLGLLALHRVTTDENVLKRATACGRRLLATQITGHAGLRTWAPVDGKSLTGFSHGAAGIAYALLRLAQASGEDTFREAAMEAIAFEDSLFAAPRGNWPDLRGDGVPGFPAQWCHGAAGIGLARLGGLGMGDTAQVREDIEAALSATTRAGVAELDQLCCGNAGRIDLMLTAARLLDRPQALQQAADLGAAVIAQGTRGYRLHPLLPPDVRVPSLFQGTAGIGYELLRLARPDALPSILLFE